MRKHLLLALTLLMAVVSAQAKDRYSVFDGNETLTFYYDDQQGSRVGQVELYSPDAVRFAGYNTQVKKIVIDESMKSIVVASWKSLFYGRGGSGTDDGNVLSNVTEIVGLENIRVTNLTTNLEMMFYGMSKIESVDISHFNTKSVTTMRYMFSKCSSLKTVNLGAMNVSALTSTYAMFMDCNSLKTIMCTTNWSESSILSSNGSQYMFHGCINLKGGKGTAYDSSKTDKTYARPDKGTSAPGYFSPTPRQQDIDELTAIYGELLALKTAMEPLDAAYVTEKIVPLMSAIDHVVYGEGITDEEIKDVLNNQVPPTFYAAKQHYLNVVVAKLKADLEALSKPGDSQACYDIVKAAKEEAAAYTWKTSTNTQQNIKLLKENSEALLAKTDAALSAQRVADAKSKLEASYQEMNVLRTYANEAHYATLVNTIDGYLQAAKAVLDDANATVEQIDDARIDLDNNFLFAVEDLLDAEKATLKESLDDLLDGIENAACEQLVADEKAKVDAFKWDYSKNATDNLAALQAQFDENWYTNISEAVIAIYHQNENAVIALINAIGTVEYTPECKSRIDAARAAYTALTAEQRTFVTNYSTLEAAEQEYMRLSVAYRQNMEQAQPVIDLINAIGEVTYSDESNNAIGMAKTAYSGLTDEQKALVYNYDVLLAAEKRYQELRDAYEQDCANARTQLSTLLSELAQLAADAYERGDMALYNELAAVYDPAFEVYGSAESTLEELEDAIDAVEEAIAYATAKAQGIEDVEATVRVQKIMMDGTLYIIRDGKVYTATGAVVK